MSEIITNLRSVGVDGRLKRKAEKFEFENKIITYFYNCQVLGRASLHLVIRSITPV